MLKNVLIQLNLSSTKAIWLFKKAALTNIDAREKSPGKPYSPTPWPNDLSFWLLQFKFIGCSDCKFIYWERLIICQSKVGAFVNTPILLS